MCSATAYVRFVPKADMALPILKINWFGFGPVLEGFVLRRRIEIIHRTEPIWIASAITLGRPVELSIFGKPWSLAPRGDLGCELSVHGFIWSKRIVGIASVHKAGVIAVA